MGNAKGGGHRAQRYGRKEWDIDNKVVNGRGEDIYK